MRSRRVSGGRDATRTVLFVCPHGAGKSRLAAAFFDAAAPSGWRATTAGEHPGEAVSPDAARPLAGTPAAAHLDDASPRPIGAVPGPTRVVAIDCVPPDVPGAVRWRLTHRVMDEAMRDELRDRAEALARSLSAPPVPPLPPADPVRERPDPDGPEDTPAAAEGRRG